MSFSEGLEVEDNSDINYALMWNSLYLGIRGNLVISGCKVEPNSPADLKLDVTAGFVWCGGAKRTVGVVDDLDLTSQQAALTSGQSQFILILWDQATTSVITLDGVAGGTGLIYPPVFDDDSQVLLALVTLSETDSQIDTSDIMDTRLFVGDGGYFAGDGEFTGALVVGGNASIGGTLGVTGLATFAEDVTLADAKDLKLTKGSYTVSVLAPTLGSNVNVVTPAGSGNLGLVSDGNYHVFSETEIKASYADDLIYSAGTLLLKNTDDGNLASVTLTDYFYTETEVIAGFGTYHAAYGTDAGTPLVVPCCFERASNNVDIVWNLTNETMEFAGSYDITLKYYIPLPTSRDGKDLNISKIKVHTRGNSTNYITVSHIYGTRTSFIESVDSNSTNLVTLGSHSLAVTADCSNYQNVWVVFHVINPDGYVRIRSVDIEYYYN